MRWADALLQDLRYAQRSLRSAPALSLMAVAVLAVAIGVSTTLFSVISAVLLRPLPYPDAERLVRLWSTGQNHSQPRYASALPDHRVWRSENRTFEDIGAYSGTALTITSADHADLLDAARLTANMWTLLGARPLYGRLFSSAEEVFGEHRVVVLGERVWRRHFGANPAVVGQVVELNSQGFTVIGVLPESFEFPNARTELWVPLSFGPAAPENTRRSRFVDQIGQLKPGVTVAQAQADLSGVAANVAREFPSFNGGLDAAVAGWQDSMVAPVRPVLWLLFGAVGFVLLIACANVANLLLARATSRHDELAIRAALGAGRARVIRLLFIESLLLASIGAVGGVVLAGALIRLLPLLGPIGVPSLNEPTMDASVVMFAVTLGLMTSLIFGLWPAKHTGHLCAVRPFNDRVVSGGPGHTRSRSALIVAEVACSIVLLIGAALLIVSLRRVQQVDLGFHAERLFTGRVTLSSSAYEPREREQFFRQLLDDIAGQPGIRAVGATTALPLAPTDWTKYFTIDDRPAPPSVDQVPLVSYRHVTPGYFSAMGAAVRRGRLFTTGDTQDAPLVAIVNEATVRRFWPNEDPIGKRFTTNQPESLMPPGAFPMPNGATSFPRITIVGVVADFRQNGLDRDVSAEVFVPHAQAGGADPETAASLYLVARTAGDPLAVTNPIRRAVGRLNRSVAVANVQSMEQRLEQTLANRRFVLWLIGGLAAPALAIALVGLYGVVAYMVGQRRRELALRAALGATGNDLVRLVMAHGLRMAATGIGIGLLLAVVLTRFISSYLFQVSAVDLGTYSTVSLTLLVVASLACWVPAARATRVDPAAALRARQRSTAVW